MSKNRKREVAQNSAAIDPAQVSPFGGGPGANVNHHVDSEALPPTPPRGPPGRMLRVADVIDRTGLSRTTIWRKVRASAFPPPLRLGENSVGWPEAVINEWLDSRPYVAWAPSSETAAV